MVSAQLKISWTVSTEQEHIGCVTSTLSKLTASACSKGNCCDGSQTYLFSSARNGLLCRQTWEVWLVCRTQRAGQESMTLLVCAMRSEDVLTTLPSFSWVRPRSTWRSGRRATWRLMRLWLSMTWPQHARPTLKSKLPIWNRRSRNFRYCWDDSQPLLRKSTLNFLSDLRPKTICQDACRLMKMKDYILYLAMMSARYNALQADLNKWTDWPHSALCRFK